MLHHLGLPAMGAPAATLGSATGMISAEKHGDGGSEEDLDIENEDDWGAQRLSWQGSGTLGGSVPDVVRPGIVHRLDKGTSGLLVVAKSDPVLVRAFRL